MPLHEKVILWECLDLIDLSKLLMKVSNYSLPCICASSISIAGLQHQIGLDCNTLSDSNQVEWYISMFACFTSATFKSSCLLPGVGTSRLSGN